MSKERKKHAPQDVFPDLNQKELLELILKEMATKSDLAEMETRITEKMADEFKPFHQMKGEFKGFVETTKSLNETVSNLKNSVASMEGEFKTARWILGILVILLLKIAFAPKLWTYTGTG